MLYLRVPVSQAGYSSVLFLTDSILVEMFKVRMQGQYGAATDKRLGAIVSEMWRDWGFRKGIMRGYWVTVAREIPAYAGYVQIITDFSVYPKKLIINRFYSGLFYLLYRVRRVLMAYSQLLNSPSGVLQRNMEMISQYGRYWPLDQQVV